jgi:MSHA biogenesis protein MshP
MKGQRGFGAIMAIVILVILASLAAAIVKFGSVQQATSAQDILSARAWQAAKAGNEWGLYQALQPAGIWNVCAGATQTLDLSAATGFWVTVTCNSTAYNEGETCTPGCAQAQIRVFRIDAVACNSAAGCPAAAAIATAPNYVERMREVIATN